VSTPKFYSPLMMMFILARFRWVALQLDALSQCRNMGALLHTLSTLPTTLDDTYARILQQIEEYERPHVRRILQWVCFSPYRLRPYELAEVHRIGGNIRPPFNAHDVLFHAEDIFSICPGFLTVTLEWKYGDKKVVQFAHFSVKEYLLSPRASSSWGFTTLESHISIVRASIACFLYAVAQEEQDRSYRPIRLQLSKYPLAEYAINHCAYHLDFITPRDHPDLEESFHALLDPRSAPLLVNKLGYCYLEKRIARWHSFFPRSKASPESLSLIIASELGLSQALRWLFSFESLRDCVDATVMYSAKIHSAQKTGVWWPLLCASRHGHVEVVQLLIKLGANVNLDHSETALGIACKHKQLAVVKILLEHGADADRARALWWSSRTGFEEGVQVLLDAGVNVNYDDGHNGSALEAAITAPLASPTHGTISRIVRVLLDAGAEVNYTGVYNRSVLQQATHVGSKEIVQMLLAAGADLRQGDGSESALQIALSKGDKEMVQIFLNAGACSDDTGDGLQMASSRGYVEVVQMMLDAGANVNQVCGEWGTPIQAASHGGHVDLVRQLLNADADVNQMGGTSGTALTAAISGEGLEGARLELVTMLLDAGANVKQVGGDWGTALQAAAETGHDEVVQILLDGGADVNEYGGTWGTALHAASCRGHKQTVLLLLQAGANVLQVGGTYGNALTAAAFEGNTEVVQILLNAGADVRSYGDEWGTALQAASRMGHKATVSLLLQAGADVNREGGKDGSALQAAANEQEEDIIRILVDAGARINWRDTNHREYNKFRGLHEAASNGNTEIIQLLLDAGANINQKRGGRTALEIASWHGHTKIVRLLLQAGGDVNQSCGPYYGSALQSASCVEIFRVLLDAGANVYQRGGQYGSALEAAAHKWYDNKEKVIQMLLDAGADFIGEGLVGQFWSLVETEEYHEANEI
jgi:ankyrin repeat protein